MTGREPGREPMSFHGRELEDVPGIMPDEIAAETMLGRDLEVLADRSGAPTSPDFADRVMAAVEREPLPAPARAAGIAIRRRSLASLAASLRDAWRVTTRPGFPIAVRAQALALVLVAAGLAAGSGLATVGAIGLFGGVDATPTPPPSLQTSTEPSPPPVESPAPSEPAMPAPSSEPSDSAGPSAGPDTETSEPAGSQEPEGKDDGGGATSTRAPSSTRTPSATRTPTPTATHTEDPEDGGDHSGDSTPTPGPTPTVTPTPTQGGED